MAFVQLEDSWLKVTNRVLVFFFFGDVCVKRRFRDDVCQSCQRIFTRGDATLLLVLFVRVHQFIYTSRLLLVSAPRGFSHGLLTFCTNKTI